MEAARAKYHEGDLFTYTLTKDRQGRFDLQWKIDGKALERRQLVEGVYVLKTNMPRQSCPLVKTLAKYKEQSCHLAPENQPPSCAPKPASAVID